MNLIKVSNSNLVSWELYKYVEGIYVVRIVDDYARGMLFLRYQEYYESPDELYYRQDFDIFDYMNTFRILRGESVFTYPEEWAGFNIPGDNLLSCIGGISRMNKYDKEMRKIVRLIRKDTGGKFYIVGVDNIDGRLLDHELAHAFYYLDKGYRNDMKGLVMGLGKSKLKRMNKLLLGLGYREDVIIDEVQSYLGTGLGVGQDKIFSVRDCEKFIKYYKKYKGKSGIINRLHNS